MHQARMMESPAAQLEAPRLENSKPLLIAGFRSHYTDETMTNIPSQWQRFAPHIGKIPGQVGHVAYGVCLRASGGAKGVDYLSGVEVSSSSGLPGEFSVAAIPAQKFAVFTHREHVSKLRETLDAIDKWLPSSGHVVAPGGDDGTAFFERYAENFNPQTGLGGIEVWIPIKA